MAASIGSADATPVAAANAIPIPPTVTANLAKDSLIYEPSPLLNEPVRSSRTSGSVVIAAACDGDNIVEVPRCLRHGLNLCRHLSSLRRWRREELVQVA